MSEKNRAIQPTSTPVYLAMLSGITLFISDYPIHFWPLHFVAMVPLMVALQTTKPHRRFSFLIGWSFALTYAIPLLLSAGSAIPVIVASFTGLLMWFVMIPCMHRLLHRGLMLGPLACAGAVCLFELVQWHLIPIFGSAQCFARVTGEAPAMIQFAAHTGLIGVVFVLVWMQALIAQIFIHPRKAPTYLVLLLLFICLGMVNWQRWTRPLSQRISVAALSWGDKTKLKLKDLCNEALAKNARIMVTPETGFICPRDSAEQTSQDLIRDVQESGLYGAIGVFRQDIRKNQILLIEPRNETVVKYEKSHLIPYMETYNPGDGSLVELDWFEARCGGMICQDDNFTDLSRGYGRRGTQLLLVPTNDWAPIRGYHFDSSRMRAIESGYGIVRAATGGYSAIVSPRGEVLQKVDNTQVQGVSVVSENMLIGDGVPTAFSIYGDWPIGTISFVFVLLAMIGPPGAWSQSGRTTSGFRWPKSPT